MRNQLIISLAFFSLSPAAQSPSTKFGASPAQQKIALANKTIEASPERCQSYNSLALALVRRAQETSDPAYYAQADEALKTSFRLAPENFEGLKARVSILLDQQEFARALEKAKELNRRVPDDVEVYGFLSDANLALGNYDEAEKAAQWMLDLRPGNVPGFLRGAALRRVYGDPEGALDFLNQAAQATASFEVDEIAGILTEDAELQLMTGKVDLAAKSLEQALQLLPAYRRAVEDMAGVRIAQGKYEEAADLLRQGNRDAPRTQGLYVLAEALQRAGKPDEAKAAYAEFELRARRQIEQPDNANPELVFFYTDHTHNDTEALRIARLEVDRRHDVYTLDAYAWALYASHAYAQARAQIEKALSVGIRDAALFYHAGAIAAQQRDSVAAARRFTQSLELNPFSEHAALARRALEGLEGASAVAAAHPSQQ
jgi:tetratricopeptide (TPR) repeat protein